MLPIQLIWHIAAFVGGILTGMALILVPYLIWRLAKGGKRNDRQILSS